MKAILGVMLATCSADFAEDNYLYQIDVTDVEDVKYAFTTGEVADKVVVVSTADTTKIVLDTTTYAIVQTVALKALSDLIDLEVDGERIEGFAPAIDEYELDAERYGKNYLRAVAPENASMSVGFAEKANAAGIPLIMKPNKVWVDNGGYHNLVIGSTGAGKTQTTVLPMVNLLAKHDESMIITDPKGELYEKTANLLRNKGYKIIVINLCRFFC